MDRPKSAYHLVARKDKRLAGKPVYYVRFQLANGQLSVWRSSGQTAKARARQWAERQIREGNVERKPTDLSHFLLNFWTPAKSEYLRQCTSSNGSGHNRSFSKRHFFTYDTGKSADSPALNFWSL